LWFRFSSRYNLVNRRIIGLIFVSHLGAVKWLWNWWFGIALWGKTSNATFSDSFRRSPCFKIAIWQKKFLNLPPDIALKMKYNQTFWKMVCLS
jgi:hypothetical protein